MNVKKIILFTILLMIVISSLSIVSAGLFDFSFGDNGPKDYNADSEINSSSIKFDLINFKEAKADDIVKKSGAPEVDTGNAIVTEGYVIPGEEGSVTYNVSFKIKISDILKDIYIYDSAGPMADENTKTNFDYNETSEYLNNNLESIVQQAINNENGWNISTPTFNDFANFTNEQFSIDGDTLSFNGQFTASIDENTSPDSFKDSPIDFQISNKDNNAVIGIRVFSQN